MADRTAKPGRTILLVRKPSADGAGVLKLSAGGKTQFYAFHEVRCDIGGRGFAVHRLGLGELYHVRVGAADECSCECLGYLRWDRCKHVGGLRALMKQGLL